MPVSVLEFEALSFPEATAYFRALGVRPTQSYKETWEEEGYRAFTVARLTQLDVLDDVKRHLDRAVADGMSVQEFKSKVGAMLAESGWADVGSKGNELGSAPRLEMIYRTNLASAWSAGNWQQMRGVADERARRGEQTLVRMNDAGDGPVSEGGRVRDSHHALNGTVLPIDHPWWRTHSTPLGYNCRCFETLETGVDAVQVNPPATTWSQHEREDGSLISVPDGITPGFGRQGWRAQLGEALKQKLAAADPATRLKMQNEIQERANFLKFAAMSARKE